jgi:hypothetical protein
MGRLGWSVAGIAAVLVGAWPCASYLTRDAQSPLAGEGSRPGAVAATTRKLSVAAFTCTPASTVHVGDTLVFQAQLEPAPQCGVSITAVNDAPVFYMLLHDDGQAPDIAPGDSVYSGKLVWREEYGTGDTMIVLTVDGSKVRQRYTCEAELLLHVLPKVTDRHKPA